MFAVPLFQLFCLLTNFQVKTFVKESKRETWEETGPLLPLDVVSLCVKPEM